MQVSSHIHQFILFIYYSIYRTERLMDESGIGVAPPKRSRPVASVLPAPPRNSTNTRQRRSAVEGEDEEEGTGSGNDEDEDEDDDNEDNESNDADKKKPK
jgi:hypothetical protein